MYTGGGIYRACLYMYVYSMTLQPLSCAAAAIVSTCETTSSMVGQDSLQNYRAECPSFSDSLLMEMTDNTGSSFLYCSTSASNPGPLTSNTVSDERQGVTKRRCVVNNPTGGQVKYSMHMYLWRVLCCDT